MAKHKKIQLAIPKPCSEDWDKMTPDEQGKFCSHCNKTVVDFSNFTDRGLADFFKNTKEKVCGNFYPAQLNRLIGIQEQGSTSYLHKALIGASLAVGLATNVNAQNSHSAYNNIQQTQPQNQAGPNMPQDTLGSDSNHYISGVVTDSNGVAVPFASIILHGNYKLMRSVSASLDGHFSIKIDSFLLGSTVDLIAEANDHTNVVVQISTNKLPIKNIKIVMSTGPAQIANIRGDTVTYIIDDTKDTTKKQSSSEYLKALTKQHLGTPASEEGSSTLH